MNPSFESKDRSIEPMSLSFEPTDSQFGGSWAGPLAFIVVVGDALGRMENQNRGMDDPNTRKALTFIAVVFIALAISLAVGRVTAGQTFLEDFSAGKEIHTITDEQSNQTLVYKVQPGDAWWKIARDHQVSTRALLEANGADLSTPLSAGQNIHLPGWVPPPSASASAKARESKF